MELTVLGCSGTFPGPDSCCSSYVLEHEGYRLLIDCGTGAVGAMQRHDRLFDIDAVYLSHLHADHCLDLVAWYYARYYHPEGAREILPVYAPEGAAERIAKAFDERPVGFEQVYDWRLAKPGHLEIGPFDVELAAMNHPVESLGMRIAADDRIFAYSSDTAVTDALPMLALNADLFLVEASWTDADQHPLNVHLSGAEAATMAQAADVDRVLLTHIVPWATREQVLDEALTVRGDRTELALPGSSYSV